VIKDQPDDQPLDDFLEKIRAILRGLARHKAWPGRTGPLRKQ